MFDDDLDDGFAPDVGSEFSDFSAAIAFGTGYAFLRHGQDRQADRIIAAINKLDREPAEPAEVHVHIDNTSDEERRGVAPVNALDYSTGEMPANWDSYIGQQPLKKQLSVYINSALARDVPLPHTLLASGYPGVGKTTMARLIAQTMGKKIIELVPPFNIYALVEAAEQLGDGDVLFIDEIHKLADNGTRGAEILLKVLEDHVAYLPDGEVVPLNKITVIGATTERDKLPEPVVDRFKIKPYFQAYDTEDLDRIAIKFSYRHEAEQYVTDELAMAMADACRGTPRIIEEMVMAARDLAFSLGRPATTEELLEFLEVEPDGLTRVHIHYLTAMRQYFARERGDEIEYIVGEPAIMQILRETKQGIGRIERFLVERGLIDRTPRGRRLTDLGIERAEEFIAAGKGASDVA